MFTGIVSHQAIILRREGGAFVIERMKDEVLNHGQSIAHDGACMSITEFTDTSYSFFAMNESLGKTTLGQKKEGDMVNIEYCLRIGDRLDGHLVTGHIDTRGRVVAVDFHHDGSRKITLSYPADFSHLIIAKGSIAINGVSLTVVDDLPDDDTSLALLSVWLIPLTLGLTNLGMLQSGDEVNLEFDMLAKYAHKR